MSKAKKIWLIVAASLVLVGSMIVGGAMAMQSWDFSKLATHKNQTNKYDITEKFADLSINTDTADIKILPSPDGKVSVECHDRENLKHFVAVEEGKLVIRLEDTRKWYQHIGISFGEGSRITVYIPVGEYGDIDVKTSTGHVEISKDFSFNRIDVKCGTGGVLCRASANEGISIKATTGDVSVEDISSKSLDVSVSTGTVKVSNVCCDEDVSIKVTTGKTDLIGLRCRNFDSSGSTGDVSFNNVIASGKLSVNRSTGYVRLSDSDAGELLIVTDTGDVKGSLLTDKIFIVNTDTGRKDVPRTTSGGVCEITTDTGDVVITISGK